MADSLKNVSISLGEYDQRLIDEQISSGRFASRSEVVRAGLRLLDDYENSQKLQRLRTEIASGEADYQSGRFVEVDNVNDVLNKITQKGD